MSSDRGVGKACPVPLAASKLRLAKAHFLSPQWLTSEIGVLLGAELTSEVALMNMHGVALGADSMVTINWHRGLKISQATSQKISIINASAPVAAMINDNLYFAGVPWTLVFERFALHCGGTPLTFDTYRDRLVAFLADFDALSGMTGADGNDVASFKRYIRGFALAYREKVIQLSLDFQMGFGEGLAFAALGQLRDEILLVSGDEREEGEDDAPPQARESIEATPKLIAFVETNLPDALETALAHAFDEIEVPEAVLPELAELAVQSILVDWLPEDFSDSQLVLAGFGAGAITPSLLAMDIAGAFAGRLKYAVTDRVETDANQESFIKTFAQAQLGTALLTGARPSFENILVQESRDALLDLVFKALSRARLSDRAKDALAKDILMDSQRTLRRSLDRAKTRHEDGVHNRFAPLLETADVDAMAEFARKFVEVTVLEHELLRADTVGRPIRVVTLTREGVRTYIDGETQ